MKRPIPQSDNIIYKLPSVGITKFKRYVYKYLGIDLQDIEMKIRGKLTEGKEKINESLTNEELMDRLNKEIIQPGFTEVVTAGIVKFKPKKDTSDDDIKKAMYLELQKPTPKDAIDREFEDSRKLRWGMEVIHLTVYEENDHGPYICTIVKSKIKENMDPPSFFRYVYDYHRSAYTIHDYEIMVISPEARKMIDTKFMFKHIYTFTLDNLILTEHLFYSGTLVIYNSIYILRVTDPVNM